MPPSDLANASYRLCRLVDLQFQEMFQSPGRLLRLGSVSVPDRKFDFVVIPLRDPFALYLKIERIPVLQAHTELRLRHQVPTTSRLGSISPYGPDSGCIHFDAGGEAPRHPVRRSRGFWLGMALLWSEPVT